MEAPFTGQMGVVKSLHDVMLSIEVSDGRQSDISFPCPVNGLRDTRGPMAVKHHHTHHLTQPRQTLPPPPQNPPSSPSPPSTPHLRKTPNRQNDQPPANTTHVMAPVPPHPKQSHSQPQPRRPRRHVEYAAGIPVPISAAVQRPRLQNAQRDDFPLLPTTTPSDAERPPSTPIEGTNARAPAATTRPRLPPHDPPPRIHHMCECLTDDHRRQEHPSRGAQDPRDHRRACARGTVCGLLPATPPMRRRASMGGLEVRGGAGATG